MLETDISLVYDNRENEEEEQQQQQWQAKSLETPNTTSNLLIIICQSSSIFIFLILIAIVPILQVFIGWHYSGACPVNQLIPHYLVVAGVVSLLLILLICITQAITRIYGKKVFDDNNTDRTNPNRATMLVGCGVCSIMCINLSLLIFLLGWSVAGLIWVMEVWHRVQYHRVESNDYCHPILYQFTFSLLLITATVKMLLFCFVCRKTCGKITSRQRKDTVTSVNV